MTIFHMTSTLVEKLACQFLNKYTCHMKNCHMAPSTRANKNCHRKTCHRKLLVELRLKMGEKNFQEFVFKISDKGEFFYGRTIAMKRDNGKEIDFAYAFYRVEFVLSKVKNEVVKLRNPIADFIFGVEKEIQYEDRRLTKENKESILGYFRKRCHEGFLREYPQIATDIKTKATSGKKEEL